MPGRLNVGEIEFVSVRFSARKTFPTRVPEFFPLRFSKSPVLRDPYQLDGNSLTNREHRARSPRLFAVLDDNRPERPAPQAHGGSGGVGWGVTNPFRSRFWFAPFEEGAERTTNQTIVVL